jgi:hypothetical protein
MSQIFKKILREQVNPMRIVKFLAMWIQKRKDSSQTYDEIPFHIEFWIKRTKTQQNINRQLLVTVDES